MPESAEVRIVADWLFGRTVGRRVTAATILGGRFVERPIDRLGEIVERRVTTVRCRGKVIVVDLQDGLSLVSTLGMTGRWSSREDDHAAVRIDLRTEEGGERSSVYFVDPRHFGRLEAVSTRAATARLDDLGWDPLEDPERYGQADVRATVASRNRRVKPRVAELLLDQSVFAGVGNYVRSEALYRAEVDPWIVWDEVIASGKAVDLYRAIAAVVAESYAVGGASLRDFSDGDGRRGGFAERMRVYGRKVAPCGRSVERTKDRGGRTVWWVRR